MKPRAYITAAGMRQLPEWRRQEIIDDPRWEWDASKDEWFRIPDERFEQRAWLSEQLQKETRRYGFRFPWRRRAVRQ